ncbi:hypothetical protein SPRG_11154 [Saprolegnia parasitica CBS 223.65]|uniref:Uncharacterized protein n=1 Tax=Saprolegnia parasitica (strain CBS 223.65) TaxID=695850 RepID=A0A067C8W0_SAPPC|nr:hypothetical protein SPRG_11154 [Saprolegnia parasitica CBS 223.65]KDO23222.1 hypothetical protein SPRG_11154 [Saprolegnia parasitica CBS 223.65]|eukprot:XP_012206020.1 hypothetical protein SPRG_11154 [Saprolegnia parasitica CBS 223.65]
MATPGLAPMRDDVGLPLDTTLFDAANLVGLGITIAAAVVSNCGVQLQKLAHASTDNETAYFGQRQWVLGLALVVLGSIGDFEALSFATQSLVATVGGGATVVTNVLFSTYWHGESLTVRDAYGTICILLGVLLIALSSPQDEEYNIDQLVSRFESPVVLAYLLVLGGLIGYLLILIQSERDATSSESRVLWSGRGQSRLRRFLRCSDETCTNIEPTLYATVSGITGSISMLLGKCASEMVKTSLEGPSQFTHPTTYFFFGGMLGTVLLQIHWFNQALMRGDIAVVFPIFQVFWIAFGVVGGMVFYGDLARLEFFQSISFLLAFACILVGVYYLAQHEPQKPPLSTPLLDHESDVASVDSSFYLEQATQVLLEPTPPLDQNGHRESPEMLNDLRRPYRPPAMLRSL